jgi:hypothetical protein
MWVELGAWQVLASAALVGAVTLLREVPVPARVAAAAVSFGDPRAYADELRAAAGVVPEPHSDRQRRRLPAVPTRESITAWLDGWHQRWDRWMVSRPGLAQSWEVVQTLRPAWWVLRAWVAVEILDLFTGPWEYASLIPRFGNDLAGLVLLVGAVVGSVLMGLRRAWPASRSRVSVLARVVLLGLNALAVMWTPVVVDSFPSARWVNDMAHPGASGMFRPYHQPGLLNDGHRVRNVFAYDAQGRPLQGVQLYDQTGTPLAVDPDTVSRMRYGGQLPRVYAWKNGGKDIWNVYPLPVRFGGGWNRSDKAWASDNPPFLPQPPLAAVPPVALPLPAPTVPEADADEPAEDTPAHPRRR